MYYSHPCSYCNKVFYVYDKNRQYAAKRLYEGIKKHLIEWDEDRREYEFDDDPYREEQQMYQAMAEHTEKPQYAYEIR